MKKVIDNAAVPFGGYFIYKHESGFVQKSPYFNVLKGMVKAYKRENNQPIGLEFDNEFEDNICANSAPQACEDFIPPSLAEKASTLAHALARAARGGFKVVTEQQFNERLAICSQCNFFTGTHSTFKVFCKKCGCAGAKLNLQSSVCPLAKW